MAEAKYIRNDWLHQELQKYAEWSLLNESDWSEASGYSGSTPVWRAMYAQTGNDAPRSRPPRGTECPRDLERIQRAYIRLSDGEAGQAVMLVKRYWELAVMSRGQPGFRPWEFFGLKQTAFYRLKDRGEWAIRGFLRA